MLIILSPAKSLDFESAPIINECSQPRFLTDSARLIALLRQQTPTDLMSLMGISEQLAVLNAERFGQWGLPFAPPKAKQAMLAFNGDVYEGLNAKSLSGAGMAFANRHVRILSGLYGLLRPLDLIMPYRLEMGTKLANGRGKDLYAFWGDTLRQAVDDELANHETPVLINLASDEYFKSVRAKELSAKVIQPVFEDWSAGRYKVVSFYAKRARGLMTRYVIDQQIDAPEQLKAFNVEGYAFEPAVSTSTKWVFRRNAAASA